MNYLTNSEKNIIGSVATLCANLFLVSVLIYTDDNVDEVIYLTFILLRGLGYDLLLGGLDVEIERQGVKGRTVIISHTMIFLVVIFCALILTFNLVIEELVKKTFGLKINIILLLICVLLFRLGGLAKSIFSGQLKYSSILFVNILESATIILVTWLYTIVPLTVYELLVAIHVPYIFIIVNLLMKKLVIVNEGSGEINLRALKYTFVKIYSFIVMRYDEFYLAILEPALFTKYSVLKMISMRIRSSARLFLKPVVIEELRGKTVISERRTQLLKMLLLINIKNYYLVGSSTLLICVGLSLFWLEYDIIFVLLCLQVAGLIVFPLSLYHSKIDQYLHDGYWFRRIQFIYLTLRLLVLLSASYYLVLPELLIFSLVILEALSFYALIYGVKNETNS